MWRWAWNSWIWWVITAFTVHNSLCTIWLFECHFLGVIVLQRHFPWVLQVIAMFALISVPSPVISCCDLINCNFRQDIRTCYWRILLIFTQRIQMFNEKSLFWHHLHHVETWQYRLQCPFSASVTEAITQLLTHVVGNKKDDVSKQMMKNIKTFDGTHRTECIDWLSQIEATAKFCNASFRELVCQGMAPAMLHVLSEPSPLSTDQEVKDVILANYSDITSTAEAAAKLQNMQMPPNEPLVSFNSRYEAIHWVTFRLSPKETKEYVKKLLWKIARKDSYIKTLKDAFRQVWPWQVNSFAWITKQP